MAKISTKKHSSPEGGGNAPISCLTTLKPLLGRRRRGGSSKRRRSEVKCVCCGSVFGGKVAAVSGPCIDSGRLHSVTSNKAEEKVDRGSGALLNPHPHHGSSQRLVNTSQLCDNHTLCRRHRSCCCTWSAALHMSHLLNSVIISVFTRNVLTVNCFIKLINTYLGSRHSNIGKRWQDGVIHRDLVIA